MDVGGRRAPNPNVEIVDVAVNIAELARWVSGRNDGEPGSRLIPPTNAISEGSPASTIQLFW
jgi:hypothetical protein